MFSLLTSYLAFVIVIFSLSYPFEDSLSASLAMKALLAGQVLSDQIVLDNDGNVDHLLESTAMMQINMLIEACEIVLNSEFTNEKASLKKLGLQIELKLNFCLDSAGTERMCQVNIMNNLRISKLMYFSQLAFIRFFPTNFLSSIS